MVVLGCRRVEVGPGYALAMAYDGEVRLDSVGADPWSQTCFVELEGCPRSLWRVLAEQSRSDDPVACPEG